MRRGWCSSRLGLLLWLVPCVTGEAQTVREVGLHGTVIAREPATWVAGVTGAVRPSPRARVMVAVGAGIRDRSFAWRGELLGHFLLNPGRRTGVAAYGGGGLAVEGSTDEQGFLVLLVGIESRPAAPAGWAIEVGVGGGIRLLAAYRWRWPGAGRQAP